MTITPTSKRQVATSQVAADGATLLRQLTLGNCHTVSHHVDTGCSLNDHIAPRLIDGAAVNRAYDQEVAGAAIRQETRYDSRQWVVAGLTLGRRP